MQCWVYSILTHAIWAFSTSMIGVLVVLHVSSLNNFNMSLVYAICDIEMPITENEHSMPRFLPCLSRFEISNYFLNVITLTFPFSWQGVLWLIDHQHTTWGLPSTLLYWSNTHSYLHYFLQPFFFKESIDLWIPSSWNLI